MIYAKTPKIFDSTSWKVHTDKPTNKLKIFKLKNAQITPNLLTTAAKKHCTVDDWLFVIVNIQWLAA